MRSPFARDHFSFLSVCALHSHAAPLLLEQGFLSSTDPLGPRPAPQPPPRPDHSATNFDHFNHVPSAARLPAACDLFPTRGARVAPSRGDPRLRYSDTAGLPRPDPDSDGVRATLAHAAAHGLARPAVTLGIATPIWPGPRVRIRTRMASESPRQRRSDPVQPLVAPARTRKTTPNHSDASTPGTCQLWTSRRTTLAGTGYQSAQQPREPHLLCSCSSPSRPTD